METFYSQKRNSCICETRRSGVSPFLGFTFELYDCLSVERLSETREASYGGPNRQQLVMDERQRQM